MRTGAPPTADTLRAAANDGADTLRAAANDGADTLRAAANELPSAGHVKENVAAIERQISRQLSSKEPPPPAEDPNAGADVGKGICNCLSSVVEKVYGEICAMPTVLKDKFRQATGEYARSVSLFAVYACLLMSFMIITVATRKPKPNWSGFVSDPSSPKYVEPACNSTIDDQLVKVFFQEGCLQRLASDDLLDGKCGVDVINLYMEDYLGAFRIENQFVNICTFLVVIMGMQTLGLPHPSGRIGTCAYLLTMSVLAFQWFTVLLSLLMIFYGFLSMRDEFRSCMNPWRGGLKLAEVVSGSSAFFHSEVLMRLLIMATYWSAICEGVQLYAAVTLRDKDAATMIKRLRADDKLGDAEKKTHAETRKAWKQMFKYWNDVYDYMYHVYLVVFLGIPAFIFGSMYLASAGEVFSIVFLFPVLLFYLLFVLILKSCVSGFKGTDFKGQKKKIERANNPEFQQVSDGPSDELGMMAGVFAGDGEFEPETPEPEQPTVQEAATPAPETTVVSEVSGPAVDDGVAGEPFEKLPPRVCDCCGVMDGKASASGASSSVFSCLQMISDLLAQVLEAGKGMLWWLDLRSEKAKREEMKTAKEDAVKKYEGTAGELLYNTIMKQADYYEALLLKTSAALDFKNLEGVDEREQELKAQLEECTLGRANNQKDRLGDRAIKEFIELPEKDDKEVDKPLPYLRVIQSCFVLLLASPFFLFGAVLAFYMTSGKSTATNMSFVGRLYRYEFESFTTLTLPEPSFDFFRINVVAGLEYTANAFMDVFVDPQPFQTEPVGAGETAAGLDGLTLVLSILKILIALLAVVLSKLDSTLVEDNWKFYDIARCTTIEEAIMVVDKRSKIVDDGGAGGSQSHMTWYVDLIAEIWTRVAYLEALRKLYAPDGKGADGKPFQSVSARFPGANEAAAYRDGKNEAAQYSAKDLRERLFGDQIQTTDKWTKFEDKLEKRRFGKPDTDHLQHTVDQKYDFNQMNADVVKDFKAKNKSAKTKIEVKALTEEINRMVNLANVAGKEVEKLPDTVALNLRIQSLQADLEKERESQSGQIKDALVRENSLLKDHVAVIRQGHHPKHRYAAHPPLEDLNAVEMLCGPPDLEGAEERAHANATPIVKKFVEVTIDPDDNAQVECVGLCASPDVLTKLTETLNGNTQTKFITGGLYLDLKLIDKALARFQTAEKTPTKIHSLSEQFQAKRSEITKWKLGISGARVDNFVLAEWSERRNLSTTIVEAPPIMVKRNGTVAWNTRDEFQFDNKVALINLVDNVLPSDAAGMAYAKGAAGVIIVNDDTTHPDDLGEEKLTEHSATLPIPVLMISNARGAGLQAGNTIGFTCKAEKTDPITVSEEVELGIALIVAYLDDMEQSLPKRKVGRVEQHVDIWPDWGEYEDPDKKKESQEYQELLDEFAGFVTNTWTQIRWDLMDRTTRVKNTEQALWLYITELIAQWKLDPKDPKNNPDA